MAIHEYDPSYQMHTHIAAVVKDIKKTAEKWSVALANLGLHPWRIFPSQKGGPDHAGRPCKMNVGNPTLINVGLTEIDALNGLQIELIEPVEGESVWSKDYDKRGPSWQHLEIAAEPEDLQTLFETFEKAGGKLTFDLEFSDGRHAFYFEFAGGISFCVAPPH